MEILNENSASSSTSSGSRRGRNLNRKQSTYTWADEVGGPGGIYGAIILYFLSINSLSRWPLWFYYLKSRLKTTLSRWEREGERERIFTVHKQTAVRMA